MEAPVTRQPKPFVVTCTGFSTAEKQWVQGLCASMGAMYQPTLEANTCSHLVCRNMIDAVNTPKYTSALRWGVKVVSWKWLLDSAAAKHALPASRYKDDPAGPFPYTPPVAKARHSRPSQTQTVTHSQRQVPEPRQPQPARSVTDAAAGIVSAPTLSQAPSSQPAPRDFTFASLAPAPPAQHLTGSLQGTPDLWRLGKPAAAPTPAPITAPVAEAPATCTDQPVGCNQASAGEAAPQLPIHAVPDQAADDSDMDVVIPGTQLMDDEDDAAYTTPESLTVFLAARRAALGQPASTGATSTHGPTSQAAALSSDKSSPPRSDMAVTPAARPPPGTAAGAAVTPASLSMSMLQSSPSDNFSVSSASPVDANTDADDPMLVSPAPPARPAVGAEPQQVAQPQLADLSIEGLTPVTSQHTLSPPSGGSRGADESPGDGMVVSPAPQLRGAQSGAKVLYSGFGSNLGATPKQHNAAADRMEEQTASGISSGASAGATSPQAATRCERMGAAQVTLPARPQLADTAAQGGRPPDTHSPVPAIGAAPTVQVKTEPGTEWALLEDDMDQPPEHEWQQHLTSDLATTSDQRIARPAAPSLSLNKILSGTAKAAGVSNQPGSSGAAASGPGAVPIKTEPGLQEPAPRPRTKRPANQAAGAVQTPVVQILQQQLLPELLARLTEHDPGFLDRLVEVTVIKELARMPRASTFKMAHAVSSSKSARFCEQIELLICPDHPKLVLTARDKNKNVVLPVLRRTVDTAGEPIQDGSPETWVVAEPVTFYCMKEDESWWMEYNELLPVAEAQRRASSDFGIQCAVPPDVQPQRELFRDVCCRHARLSEVVGSLSVSRSQKIRSTPSQSALRALHGLECTELLQLLATVQLHQRYGFDGTTGEVLVNEAPVQGLVLDP